MNQWQPGQAEAMFQQGTPTHLNPAAMYGNNLANPSQFDLSNTNSPFQPGLQNGGMGSHAPTPSFTTPSFNPSSVVPQKRAHDGGMSGSPPPPAQVSRSQTPSYGGFSNQPPGSQFPQGPTPYAHLQQPPSTQATPSPTMHNQQYRQPSQQPRMQNASPSPFPGQQTSNFAAQMSPAPGQGHNIPTTMPPQNQMSGFGAQYGMQPNAMMQGMQGMQSSMGAPGGSNMAGMSQTAIAQRQYQMRLMQQQAQMRQNGGLSSARSAAGQPPMYGSAGSQQGAQVPNGQSSAQMNPAIAAQMKRNTFLKQCATYTQSQGRQFNPSPTIGAKVVDLYGLFQLVANAGGSAAVDRLGKWAVAAHQLGMIGPGYENAGEQLKIIYGNYIVMYEKAWQQARQSQKQEQARQQAHQMAGFGPPQQSSPTKTMQPPPPQNQYGNIQPGQHSQPQPHATPVQANASMATANGMTTPQHLMGGLGTIHHRRNSSMKKPDALTPQSVAAPSPAQKIQRSPSVKQEPSVAIMKSEEPQSTNYVPQMRSIEWDGGYDIPVLHELGAVIQRTIPSMPTVDEMGVIDTRAITLSLASGIHGEVRYALDALAIISIDQRISFDLEKCEDLIDVLIDCAEEQTDQLSEDAAEVSDALDLPSYEDVMRGSRSETESLQDIPAFGTQAYELDRAADRLVAISTVLRNFSFYEHNHRLLTTGTLIKWLSNTIRLLGTRHMLLRTYYNTQDFYKDMIIFLSNITQSLELPSRDDALHILHFLLSFAPQPSPSYTETHGKLLFPSFAPSVHRYLPPAVDCLAKLLARQDPNRALYKSIFTAPSSSLASSEAPLDLLTRAFALSISVLPDRSKGTVPNSLQLRIVEARKAYLTQGMLAADILANLAPGNDHGLARAWLESEDGWARSLLSLASLLSVDQAPRQAATKSNQQMGWDAESFKLIAYRSLAMMKRLAEKAGKSATRELMNGFGDSEDGAENEKPERWEGVPLGHAVVGALMLPNCDKTSLGLLCGLHEMAMRE